MAEARAPFREAGRLAPDWPAPLNDLAWILATHPDAKVRQPEEAIRLAECAAVLSDRRDPTILDTLAAGYAAAGRFPKAIETAVIAMDRPGVLGMSELADQISRRLELYRQEKTFVEGAP